MEDPLNYQARIREKQKQEQVSGAWPEPQQMYLIFKITNRDDDFYYDKH